MSCPASSQWTITSSNRRTSGSIVCRRSTTAGPLRVQRSVGRMDFIKGSLQFTGDTGPGSGPMDLWLYDDLTWAIPHGMAQVDHLEELSARSITFDEMIPACYEQTARLKAMDVNHTEASLTFPSFPRFCGQTSSSARTRTWRHSVSRRTTTG